jgi:hypothetical protein
LKKIYIYAPDFDENSGGAVVLHRLCHLINQTDTHQAYLTPRKFERFEFYSLKAFMVSCKSLLSNMVKRRLVKLKCNSGWDTPVDYRSSIDDDSIVVYSEMAFGNPLRAKNVVRWFLHQPGHILNAFHFGRDELYFRYASNIKPFEYCYSTMSKHELRIVYYPLDKYNDENLPKKRGTCHLIRKGGFKKKIHPADSIQVDGLSHDEISKIFRRSERFISYDDYTAYSTFAALCGCESIVVPAENVSKSAWYPREEQHYGIAFGFNEEELAWAKRTVSNLKEKLRQEDQQSFNNTRMFLDEVERFFK